MNEKVFLAGASGAIGKRLVPLLLGTGHAVFGTTRSESKAAAIRPEIMIHQLTELPPGADPSRMAAAVAGNARVRDEGTRNLVAAAIGAGARRLISQSIAWMYAPGPQPYLEEHPLDLPGEGRARHQRGRRGSARTADPGLAPPSRGSSCDTATSTAREPAGINPPGRRRCMWTLRHTPRCSRTNAQRSASSTLPKTPAMSRPRRLEERWVGPRLPVAG